MDDPWSWHETTFNLRSAEGSKRARGYLTEPHDPYLNLEMCTAPSAYYYEYEPSWRDTHGWTRFHFSRLSKTGSV